MHFNPRPASAGRPWKCRQQKTTFGFQSTPRKRGATTAQERNPPTLNNFNPRPASAGRQGERKQLTDAWEISIHAPQARGDTATRRPNSARGAISIHAPQARGDEA